MARIEKKNGYVYLVEGDKGFETYYNMGKDIEDERWKEEAKEVVEKLMKKTNKKKSED